MKINEKSIEELFRHLKQKAKNAFCAGHYNKSLKYLELASLASYQFYLSIRDDEIEQGLASISELVHKCDSVNSIKNKCVFYDAHSISKGGLTQQYIRAIIASGWKMVYLTEASKTQESFLPILEELKLSQNVEIDYIPQEITGIERVQYIYDRIISSNAERLFIHIRPTTICAVAAFDALPHTIEKFQINFTDHAFWPGVNCLDYSMEFRRYGCAISIRERRIDPSRVFLMPFYPIETDAPFDGFPFKIQDKIVCFSGGAYYKVVDEDDSYFKLCEKLLSIDPRIRIVYAGYGDENLMKKKICEYSLSDRFFLLGFRNDISSIFDHCDIYLDTSPHSGGLMCQYAARHSVPILSLNKWSVEELVCQIDTMKISSSGLEDFMDKAEKLVTDATYRSLEGGKLARCCISTSQFNNAFKKTVEEKQTQFKFDVNLSSKEIDCNRLAKIQYENETKTFQRSFVRRYGVIKSLIEYPVFVINSVTVLIKENRFWAVLSKYFKVFN